MTSSTSVGVTAGPGTDVGQPSADHVAVSIDGLQVAVPRGTLIIRAAEQVGVEIPRFCDHPLLDPVAACRACLVEIEGQPKPQPACAIPVADGMKVHTADSSEVAAEAQHGVLEFLLINHPLDCPVCDKGGECPLQNQAMSHGPDESRFTGRKRTFPKPVALSAQILLDRERCVSCARCTRFAEQIAGDPFITLQQRGAQQVVGIAADTPFNSYFSGNTIQICPVGALTSAEYRFRARPFDLVSTPTVCEHCASGCALRTDVRRSTVMRRLAWDDPAVNQEWNCDKGRFAFPYLASGRLTEPLLRGPEGLAPTSWPDAVRAAAKGLREAHGRTAVVLGGKLTLEDAYVYAKFTRVALGCDNIDFRIRRTSTEEADFLRSVVSGSGLSVTYDNLTQAPSVLLVGLDPEEESPIIFLRLRQANRKSGARIFTVAPFASAGTAKLSGRVLVSAPGQESAVLGAVAAGRSGMAAQVLNALREPGSVILVGERAADCPGALTAAVNLAGASGAKLAWVPRRAGERAAVEAGALPGLLPWGRPLGEVTARDQVAVAWDIDPDALPDDQGMDLPAALAAIAADRAARAAADPSDPEPVARVAALLLAGVDCDDLPDPAGFLSAVGEVPFVVAVETRLTEVAGLAQVVLPVGAVTEKAGTFIDWEGRARPFGQVHKSATTITDARVLGLLARELGRPIGSIEVADLRRELAALGRWQGSRPPMPAVAARPASPETTPGVGEAVLATWRHLLDEGNLQRGDDALAGTARPALARMSAATASGAGLADEQLVAVSTATGSVTLPVAVTQMPDQVVWLPTNSAGCDVHGNLRVTPGGIVRIRAGGGA